MKAFWLAGAALAAALGSPLPANAASPTTAEAVMQPHWTAGTSLNEGGRALVDVLRRAPLDGFASGPAIAQRAESLLASGASEEANRMLSDAWVRYIQALQQPTPGMEYADPSANPRHQSQSEILSAAASTPSLAGHVAKASSVNPVYDALRAAAWQDMQLGEAPDRRVIESLAHVRAAPDAARYVIVDAASAELWMIENGRIAGTMKVITGDADNATPMIASTLRSATFNPYWNVPQDLVAEMIAPRVLDQGIAYLTERDYQVFDGDTQLDPAAVDWAAVRDGRTNVHLRRAPGEWNSMGSVKFGFANSSDIFLHDTPNKELFAKEDRNLSHGCIRLADAPALARWLMNGAATPASDTPELSVWLPKSVPIYITYLTAQAENGRIAFNDDVYGKSRSGGMRVAGLR